MSAEQNELKVILEEIKKIVIETQEKVDIIRDELIEALEEQNKQLTERIQIIDVYQKKTLEPNQQILNEGLNKIWEAVKGIQEAQEIEEDKEGAIETE